MNNLLFTVNKYGFPLAVFFLFVAIFFEGSFIHLPLTLVFLLLMYIFTKSIDMFLVAFLAGLVLDTITVERIGISSLFFIIMIFLTSLYSRKYEIQTLAYVFIMGFIGAFLYILSIEQEVQMLYALTTASVGVMFFIILQKFRKSPKVKIH
jgi:cell shape-determining protein MreD